MNRMMFLSIMFLLFAYSCGERNKGQQEKMLERENTISTNYNSFIEDVWNNGDMDQLNAISVENSTRYLNGIQVAGNRNEIKANMAIFLKGFPDTEVTIGQVILKDDYLFANWMYTGTNTGVFGEMPPTGKNVRVSGYSKVFFDKEGKIAQEDVFYNELELLQQLGYTLNRPVVE